MTEKKPDFVKRVEKKFMPHIFITPTPQPNRDDLRLQMYLTREYEIEKLIAMGGTLDGKNDDGMVRCIFGHDGLGKSIKWIPYYYDPSYDYLTFDSRSLRQNEYKYHLAIDSSGHKLEFKEHEAAHETIFGFFGIKEWRSCHQYYSQKYEARKKAFEAKNPIWTQLRELDSPEIKVAMSEDERKTMRNLYEAKLKKDPDYQGLQVLKQDVFDLATYVKYLEKQERKDKREGFKKRLGELKTEYDSSDVKEALPDEKRRLSIRGIMHKKLKRESGN